MFCVSLFLLFVPYQFDGRRNERHLWAEPGPVLLRSDARFPIIRSNKIDLAGILCGFVLAKVHL